MKTNLRRTVLGTSIAWGLMLLVVGFFASFSIGVNDTLTSLLGFFLIFILTIIASISARWVPMVSGTALLASVIVVLIGFYASGGIMDVLRALARVYLWFHIVFGIAFIVVARRINNRAIDGRGSG